MSQDRNWKKTKLTVEDLSLLLGVPTQTINDFLIIFEELLLHQTVEVLRESYPYEDLTVEVELPRLGTLLLYAKNVHTSPTVNFAPSKFFYKRVRQVFVDLNSPLVDQASTILGDHLLNLYREVGGGSE